jgi:NADH-quinone oxidoreductase subunit N
MSLYQVNLMRLIGYSAIIHISYGLLGIIQGSALGTLVGIFYIITYCFLNVGLFLIIIILKNNNLVNELHLIKIVDFLKILNPNIFLSNIITSIFFAMAGIPPLSGFYIKMYIYLSLVISYNNIILIILLLIGIVTSVYYIRLIRLNLFNGQKNIDNIIILDINIIIILILLFIINISFTLVHIFCIINIFSLI